MKISRLAGLVLVAMMALSFAVASTAFAEPEFTPTGGTVKGNSTTTNELVAGGNSITCTGNTTNTGTVSSATLLSGITVDFLGCKSSGSGGSNCSVKSENTSNAGLILTNTLHAVLGLILPKGTGSGVGLLLLPAVSKGVFVEIEGNTCTAETAVEGNVAAEWLLLLHIGNFIHLHFRKGTTGESIKDFDLSTGGLVLPALKAFGIAASQTTEEELDFTPGIEVT